MSVEVFANTPAGTVTAGGTDAPASGTSESLTVTATVAFPVASTSGTPPTVFHVCDVAAPSELMRVTVAPGGTGTGQAWTVIRGAEGTTPVAHATGFTIAQVITAGWLNVPAWIYVGSGGPAPAFAADWANFSHTGADLAFRLHQDGDVEIIGVITPSAGATDLLFTLPTGYIPASSQFIFGADTTAGQAGWWEIATDGTVRTANSVIDGDTFTINGKFSLSI